MANSRVAIDSEVFHVDSELGDLLKDILRHHQDDRLIQGHRRLQEVYADWRAIEIGKIELHFDRKRVRAQLAKSYPRV